MDQTEISRLLDDFAGGAGLLERSAAITRLMKAKVLGRHSQDPRFNQGLRFLLDVASNPDSGVDRLVAIYELVRITQIAKKLRKDLGKWLEPAFRNPLPPPRELKSPDARFYFAKACAIASSSWLTEYLAIAVAQEETAERVRSAFLEGLFQRVGSLAEAFKLLAEALGKIAHETERSGDSTARRVTRVLAAIRPVVVKSNLEPGANLGSALTALIREPLAKNGVPESESVRLALAKETALAIHDIVRTRFSVSSDPGTYGALRYSRQFFSGTDWPTELRAELDLLETDIAESILLLGKQGIADSSLIEVLELVCGYRERTRAVARDLAERHPDLPEHVRSWLRTGRLEQRAKSSDVLQESRLIEADPVLAALLVDLERLKQSLVVVRTDVLSALQVYDPRLRELLEKFGDHVTDIVHHVENLANKRGLMLFGETGTSVEYIPKYFELVGTTPSRMVKIIRPAVVRRAADGSPGAVVLKGLAE